MAFALARLQSKSGKCWSKVYATHTLAHIGSHTHTHSHIHFHMEHQFKFGRESRRRRRRRRWSHCNDKSRPTKSLHTKSEEVWGSGVTHWMHFSQCDRCCFRHCCCWCRCRRCCKNFLHCFCRRFSLSLYKLAAPAIIHHAQPLDLPTASKCVCVCMYVDVHVCLCVCAFINFQ